MKKKNSAIVTVVVTLIILALSAFVFVQPMLNTSSFTEDSDFSDFLGQAFGKYPKFVNEKDFEKVELVEIGNTDEYQYVSFALDGFIEKRDAYYDAYNAASEAGTELPEAPDFSKELKVFQTSNSVDGLIDVSLFKNASEVNIMADAYKVTPTLEEVKDMTGLKVLYIEPATGEVEPDSIITDISVLADKTELTSVSLAGNAISDISALSALANLENVVLDKNNISDISALSGKEKLKAISLSENSISDISAIATLNALESLALDENEIADISALNGKETITNLSLSSNNIVDISPVATLKNIMIASLSTNEITDVSSLAAFSDAEDQKFILLSENEGITNWETLDVLPENVMIIGKPADETEEATEGEAAEEVTSEEATEGETAEEATSEETTEAPAEENTETTEE